MRKNTTRRITKVYKDPYHEREIKVLVEDNEELRDSRSKPWIHVRLMDVDKAWKALPPAEKEAVLLCGFVGLTARSAGILLGVNTETAYSRYMRGLDYLASNLKFGG